MPRSAFNRARRYGFSSGLGIAIFVISVCAAVLIPLLIIDLGLIAQLLVNRGAAEPPAAWMLRPWFNGPLFDWPFGGNYDRILLLLVGVGSLAACLEAGACWLLDRLVHRQALNVAEELRQRIHDQAFRLGTHDLLGVAKSRPEALFVEHVEQLRGRLVAWWRTVPGSWVALAFLLVLAVSVNFWLTLLALVLCASIVRMYRGLQRRGSARSRHWQASGQSQSAQLLQNLGLAPLSIGYALQEPPGERFMERLKELKEIEFRLHTSEAFTKPAMLLTVLLAAGFLLLVVGLREDVTVAGAVAMAAALICAYFPGTRLLELRQVLESGEATASEIFAYLDRETAITEMPDAKPLERVQRDVRLDQITLADRRGSRLLDQVSLTIPAGERVAILASDPQASIALAGLFVRFYDPAAGRILYDGQDICRATLDTVRGQALLVTGNGPLLPGTVTDNIACGDSGFTALQIADAAKNAEAYEFIQAMPDSFATVLDGAALRPDQHFRIGLARALLREPSLLVIEEPTGDFDEATMHELEVAIEQSSRGRTVVLLPSMILTLRTAARVFVLHEGRLAAEGTHADLVQTNELYRHLNYVRFNVFRNKIKW